MATSESRGLHLKSGLLLLAVFVAGAATGGGVHAWLGPRHPPQPPPHLRGPPPGGLPGWLKGLDLSEEQKEKARAIFEKHRPELQAVFEESFPKARAVHERIEQELGEVLTEAQRAKLEELKKQRPHRGPGGPPPGAPGDRAGPG